MERKILKENASSTTCNTCVQAIEVNRFFGRLPPLSSVIVEAGDIIVYNKAQDCIERENYAKNHEKKDS